MIKLTDPDGDPILVQENYIAAVMSVGKAVDESGKPVPNPPKSIVVVMDKTFPVKESVEDIENLIKFGPGFGTETPA